MAGDVIPHNKRHANPNTCIQFSAGTVRVPVSRFRYHSHLSWNLRHHVRQHSNRVVENRRQAHAPFHLLFPFHLHSEQVALCSAFLHTSWSLDHSRVFCQTTHLFLAPRLFWLEPSQRCKFDKTISNSQSHSCVSYATMADDPGARKLGLPPPAISQDASACASPTSYLGLTNAGSPRAETKSTCLSLLSRVFDVSSLCSYCLILEPTWRSTLDDTIALRYGQRRRRWRHQRGCFVDLTVAGCEERLRRGGTSPSAMW